MSNPENLTEEEDLNAPPPFPRLLFMVGYALILSIARLLFWSTVIIQFFWTVFGKRKNPGLLRFGGAVAAYIYRVMQYLSYTSDERPFPFKARSTASAKPGSPVRRRLNRS